MLSPQAEQTIQNYLHLPFKGVNGVRCPYFNNRRLNQRGQLRVLAGKGAPEEIVEEAQIISIHYHNGLFDKNGNCCLHNSRANHTQAAEKITKFLVDNNLGIECSGFVTHTLRRHFLETKRKDILKTMPIASWRNFIRWVIAKLRPLENINVKTYADNRNSTLVGNGKKNFNYAALQPGDLMIMLETGPQNKRNHIVLIRDVQQNTIAYVHARAWTSEGLYGHGVAEGTITITKPGSPLLEQAWEEKGVTGTRNETYLEAKQAKVFEIRRLKI